MSSSDREASEGDQPVCDGTQRKTFEATFLAFSNKHNFLNSTRTDILKFLQMITPKPNLPTLNYAFKKNLVYYISQTVSALWLSNFAGSIIQYGPPSGPLNLKVWCDILSSRKFWNLLKRVANKQEKSTEARRKYAKLSNWLPWGIRRRAAANRERRARLARQTVHESRIGLFYCVWKI